MGKKLFERPCRGCNVIKLVPKEKLSQQCATCYHKSRTIHGMSFTKLYSIWRSMKQRCLNKKDKQYHLYGARGISISDKWKTFDGFYRDVGAQPPGMSIDRIDNNGNYELGNVRWVSMKVQQNNKRNNILLNAFGKTQNITQWAEEFGLTHKIISKRIQLGWEIEKAVSSPVMKQFSRSKQNG